MSGFVHHILGAPTWAVLLIAGGVVFAEDALFVGFVLPGETAAILGGVAARLGHAPLPAVIVTVVVAAVFGDSVGYEVGRHMGPRILTWSVLDQRRERLEEAQDFLARRGGAAVFLGRWVAFFRAVMPALAGSARMPYRRFLVFNPAGGLAWGVAVVLAGYAAGASYAKVESTVGKDGAAVVLVMAVAAFVVHGVRKRRRESTHARSRMTPGARGSGPVRKT